MLLFLSFLFLVLEFCNWIIVGIIITLVHCSWHFSMNFVIRSNLKLIMWIIGNYEISFLTILISWLEKYFKITLLMSWENGFLQKYERKKWYFITFLWESHGISLERLTRYIRVFFFKKENKYTISSLVLIYIQSILLKIKPIDASKVLAKNKNVKKLSLFSEK